MPRYLSSADAAARLNVSRQTLYAYVSRGLLQASPGPTSRESLYLAEDVERLTDQRKRGRKPKEVAKATLNWGLPVLESAITLIRDGRLFYRGHDAALLAREATVETLAGLLWSCRVDDAFGVEAPACGALPTVLASVAGRRAEETLLSLFTVASDDAPTATWQPADRLAAGCGALVRLMAASLLGRPPDTAPIHRQCALAWGVDAAGADLIRMALVLCADHELNASSFTARCVASTGASLRAAVVAGLAALTGGKHGGLTARTEALWDDIGDTDIAARMRQRLARGEDLPGFGHHLYPAGDGRAARILAPILPAHPAWQTMIDQAHAQAGLHPTLDVALVALRRHLGLPVGAAFGLFALGRTVGWIAQALEQRTDDQLIRPRAAYVGVDPVEVAGNTE